MRKQIIISVVLMVLLIVSNVWWAYKLVDVGITQTYMNVALEDNKQALNQTLAILPIVSQGAPRDKIISAAKMNGDKAETFEKEGFVVVGRIGLKFDQNGKLVKVVRSWEPS